MNKLIFTTLLATLALTGCAKEASFDSVEQSRSVAKQNANYNAKAYRGSNPQYQGWGIVSDGDSTISPKCVQGDGWATLFFTNPQNPANKVKIKCSTYSGNIACLPASEFVKKEAYNAQEGSCNKDVPNPIKKINES